MAIKEDLICTGVNWIDVTDPTVQEMQQLSKQYGLNQHIVRDCMQPEHLPKYEYVDEVHFLILRFYAHEQDKPLATIQDLTNKLAIFYTDHFLITIHKSHIPFLQSIYKKYVTTGRCTSVSNTLTHIAWNAMETFEYPASILSDQVDFHETQIMMRDIKADHMEALYSIKREASIGQKILMLMLEPLNHLYIKQGEEAALQDVRDQHLKIQTLYNQVLENVNNLMNLYLSFSAQRTNDVMKVLTIFSVFFMPLTFIAGIYGMNFEFMPELSKRWGYPAVLILMVIVTAVIYQWFKRKQWL
jgi:magnesium transporter